MRYSWTTDALDQVRGQGLSPTEVHEALNAPRRLIQPVNGVTRRVLAYTKAGRLIEVWLRESAVDDEFEVWIAFEAGMVGQATWKNAFGEG